MKRQETGLSRTAARSIKPACGVVSGPPNPAGVKTTGAVLLVVPGYGWKDEKLNRNQLERRRKEHWGHRAKGNRFLDFLGQLV